MLRLFAGPHLRYRGAPHILSNASMTHRILLCSYAQFQISDGTAGNAAAQANAVFVGENLFSEIYGHEHAAYGVLGYT